MFKIANAVIAFRNIYRTLPVASGVTISEGDVVKLENGRFDLCATNQVAFGVSRTHGSVTGNVGGTTFVEATMVFGTLWEAEQGALSDAATQPGDRVDINGTSDGLTTAANYDFRIWEVDRPAGLLYGSFQRTFN
jgi:hypothetical protein